MQSIRRVKTKENIEGEASEDLRKAANKEVDSKVTKFAKVFSKDLESTPSSVITSLIRFLCVRLCIQIKKTVISEFHNCLIIIVEIGRIELPTL